MAYTAIEKMRKKNELTPDHLGSGLTVFRSYIN